jgi:hypothetical protein
VFGAALRAARAEQEDCRELDVGGGLESRRKIQDIRREASEFRWLLFRANGFNKAVLSD